jgi:uncharacterized protein with PQ loop repeat
MSFEWAGWIATIGFSLCYIPQIVHTWKVKHVDQVSVWLWILQLVGYSSGMVYGFWLKQTPLIAGYLWGFGCTVLYLVLYFIYRKN